MRTRRHARAILWFGAAIVLLIALYFGLELTLKVPTTEGPKHHNYHLSVSASNGVGPLPIFEVKQGDSVTLTVSSDRPGSVHVHGYEKEVVLNPGGNASLTFTAGRAGRFAVHLHDPDATMQGLAALEVQPR